MTPEENCRMFCAWKGGWPCLADDLTELPDGEEEF